MKSIADAYSEKARILSDVNIAIEAAVLGSEKLQAAVARLKEVQRDYFELLIAKADKQIPLDVTEETTMDLADFILTSSWIPQMADTLLRQRKAAAKKRARKLYSSCFPDAIGNESKRDLFELLRKATRNGDLELIAMVEEKLGVLKDDSEVFVVIEAIDAQVRLMQGSKLFDICRGFYSGSPAATDSLLSFVLETTADIQAKLPLPVVKSSGFVNTEGHGF
jgi:hypothetical protein